MKHKISLAMASTCCLLGLVSFTFGQTPISTGGGTPSGFSRNVVGTLTVNSAAPGGCSTRLCTTNHVQEIHCTITNPHPVVVCHTNIFPHLECTTNFVTEVHCRTNDIGNLVCETNTFPRRVCTTNFITVVRCETNIVGTRVCTTNLVPRVSCTNIFSTITSVKLRETLSGSMTPNPDCDEAGSLFPPDAQFEAVWFSNLRLSDWRGLHNGTFKIRAGTNVVASGIVSGSNGVGSHGALEPCALCSHFEGSLRGYVFQPGLLRVSLLQATYAGDLTEVDCGSTNIPQGAVNLTLDGVVVTPPCPTGTSAP